MSGRLLRRVLQERKEGRPESSPDPGIVPGDEDDDEEASESPVSTVPTRNPFDLLDDQDDEHDVDDEAGHEGVIEQPKSQENLKESVAIPVPSRKSKKKKKKDITNLASSKIKDEISLDVILKDLSISRYPPRLELELEDGKSQGSVAQCGTKKHDFVPLLIVDPKHLKAENELRRIFGSKVVGSVEKSQIVDSNLRRQSHVGRRVSHNLRKTILVTPSNYWPRWDVCMSMELLETKSGIHYFRYVHTSSYHLAQEAFEAAKAVNDLNVIARVLANNPYHIESLLTFAELFKYSGEHQASADAIAKCLYALECAWHPQFNPLQGNCQLQYIHETSKPLFSALFCHMKNMDRRGCHRTALEVCKLLLALDLDDPKGALFCVDYFALRAQEYEWLELFSDNYRSDTSIWLFPNFSYSLAICRFYLDLREGTSNTKKLSAVDLMKQALMLHPLVLKKLVEKAPLKDASWTQILSHSYFGSAKAGSPTLDHLINIYVERNYLMWRIPELQHFLKEAALLVIESVKQNSNEIKDWACVRKEAFSSAKNEYSHLMVSDFSDVVPTIPPEELQHLMVGPQMLEGMQGVHDDDRGAAAVPERGNAPREVVGRNGVVVFLESLLPWVDFGNNRDGHAEDRGG